MATPYYSGAGDDNLQVGLATFGTHKLPTITTKIEAGGNQSVVGRRRVRVHDQPTATLIFEGWSAADGTLNVERIRPGKYYIVAFDHTGQNAAVAESDIPSEPME